MDILNELYKTIDIVINKSGVAVSPIPIFSFEGLPGAGKTTQIELVSKYLTNRIGKSYYIDLPTKSPIGKILKSLYSSETRWNEVRFSSPWLNPILLSTDLRIAIDKAINEGAKFALMSRGVVSTYYYNLDAYGKNDDVFFNNMKKDMKAFYNPTAIFFLDIPEEIAYQRVVSRNRGPLRKMDEVNQMKQDKSRLLKFINNLNDIPVYFINALGSKEEVTKRIVEKLEAYLKYE